jgi:hypothetical protein
VGRRRGDAAVRIRRCVPRRTRHARSGERAGSKRKRIGQQRRHARPSPVARCRARCSEPGRTRHNR